MLRRLLARPQSTPNALRRTTLPAAGPRPLRHQSNQSPSSRSNQPHGTPPPPPHHAHETRPQKTLRYLNPSAAPPLLARFPTLHLLTRICTLFLAFFITAHIFMEYFYILTAAYGISMLPTIASSGDWLLISKYYRRGREEYGPAILENSKSVITTIDPCYWLGNPTPLPYAHPPQDPSWNEIALKSPSYQPQRRPTGTFQLDGDEVGNYTDSSDAFSPPAACAGLASWKHAPSPLELYRRGSVPATCSSPCPYRLHQFIHQ
ncbi:hypothetical protein D0869_12543 [Hortaea werneckii]|uniref:Uncharacterized protein n=1 Tax=Hortaea werneckii TaxID=91943 RepID=A0A3M6W7E3_HORWE|nr:hypothetical protein D0869_12543 [Hortaea werneckii]